MTKLDLVNAARDEREPHVCGCVGPQNGQPLCPCRMRGVQVINGRYVEVRDLGPVDFNPTPLRPPGSFWRRPWHDTSETAPLPHSEC